MGGDPVSAQLSRARGYVHAHLAALVALGVGLTLALWQLPSATGSMCRAHELDFQTLQLIWDPASTTLRGQIIVDPRRVGADAGAHEQELLTQLQQHLKLELDGELCPLRFSVRELWVPAGATLGDVVMFSCVAVDNPTTLRVYAGPWLHGLQVTVQRPGADAGIITDQMLLLGGRWSPEYDFRSPQAGWPVRARPSTQPLPQPGWDVAARYLTYGVDHILDDGWDHVAFVATLALGAAGAGFSALLARMTAFTVAHSITLALGALGWVVMWRSWVELLIALSIVVMALLTVANDGLPGDASSRRHQRWALGLAWGFGLLHGQGFASVLTAAGLPVSALLLGLLAFNLGVELGQGLWACGFWLLLGMLGPTWARRVRSPCALLLTGLGLYWAWQRVGFLLR